MSGASDERRRAELALDGRAAADLSDLQKRQWPSVAERIHAARLRTGLSDTEVARRLGMTVESYEDLERRGDEAFTVVSLRDLEALGRILGAQPRLLLLGPEAERLKQVVTFGAITARLAERVSEGGLTAERLGDLIGWDVKELLGDSNALWGFSVEALYDICKSIGLDWVEALPEAAEIPQRDR